MPQLTNLKVEGPEVISNYLAFKISSNNPIEFKSLEQSFIDYCNTKFAIEVWGEKSADDRKGDYICLCFRPDSLLVQKGDEDTQPGRYVKACQEMLGFLETWKSQVKGKIEINLDTSGINSVTFRVDFVNYWTQDLVLDALATRTRYFREIHKGFYPGYLDPTSTAALRIAMRPGTRLPEDLEYKLCF
jgi:hypothetical protein